MQFTIKTTKREEIIDITSQVSEVVAENADENSKVCLVYVPHTTCGILINENYDSDVQADILDFLKNSVPKSGWKHSEGNSDAHIKASLIGTSQLIPIENSVLGLGKWQGVALCEFDGPRERKVIVKII